MAYERASNYWFEDDEKKLRGSIRFLADRTARGELALGDLVSNRLEVEPGHLGLVVSAVVRLRHDADSVHVIAALPRLNVDPQRQPEPFDGVGVVMTKRSTIGGTTLVHGPLETYDVRLVHGGADVLR